jgi:U4/U6.U5 tri-snRNP-associated protein 2
MDTKDTTNGPSKKNEREEDSFSDDDVAVHSVRFKRKKIDAGDQRQTSTAGGAPVNGVATAATGTGAAAGKGSGLYLDTIRRYMLDFDFEKVCSVSLSNLNVYACLVCGKYFQGMWLSPLHAHTNWRFRG